jgi:hypothetical protein
MIYDICTTFGNNTKEPCREANAHHHCQKQNANQTKKVKPFNGKLLKKMFNLWIYKYHSLGGSGPLLCMAGMSPYSIHFIYIHILCDVFVFFYHLLYLALT